MGRNWEGTVRSLMKFSIRHKALRAMRSFAFFRPTEFYKGYMLCVLWFRVEWGVGKEGEQ
jgi:hypothetical protein